MIDLDVVWNAFQAGYFDHCGTIEEAERRVERLCGLEKNSVCTIDTVWPLYPDFKYKGRRCSCYIFWLKSLKPFNRPVPL